MRQCVKKYRNLLSGLQEEIDQLDLVAYDIQRQPRDRREGMVIVFWIILIYLFGRFQKDDRPDSLALSYKKCSGLLAEV